jgi:hypothetical protein
MNFHNVTRNLVSVGALAGLVLASGSAFAGPECEGAGLSNNFPGPTLSNARQTASATVQIVDMGIGSWTAYASGTMGYDTSQGTTLSGTVLAAFSDRFTTQPPSDFRSPNPFDVNSEDSWTVTVTETGLVTLTNNTWGGTSTWQGTCAGTDGALLAVGGGNHFLITFGPPIVEMVLP